MTDTLLLDEFPDRSPLLVAQDLSFGYGRKPPVIEGFTEQFHSGQVVCIVGPSGRGKSTLLYILGLMLRPRSGTVLVEDQAASDERDAARSRRRALQFGFVFQDAALDPTRSILDNILETALYRGDDRKSLLERAHQLMVELGVDLRADHRPGQISGGQAQRVALCRALLPEPQIVLADEPTGNLDSASTEVVVRALHGVAGRGGVVVCASHDPRLIDVCDRVIEL